MADWLSDLANIGDQLTKSLEDVSKMASDFDFDEMREEEEAEELEAEEDDDLEVVNEVEVHGVDDHRAASPVAPVQSKAARKVKVTKVEVLDTSGFDFDDVVDDGLPKIAATDARTTNATSGVSGGDSASSRPYLDRDADLSHEVDPLRSTGNRVTFADTPVVANFGEDNVTAKSTVRGNVDDFDDWDDGGGTPPPATAHVPVPSTGSRSSSSNAGNVHASSGSSNSSVTYSTESNNLHAVGSATSATAGVLAAAAFASHGDSSGGGGSSSSSSSSSNSSSSSRSIYRDDVNGNEAATQGDTLYRAAPTAPGLDAGVSAANRSKDLVAQQLKQQQMKKPRKKKRKGGGDKSLDFFGISSSSTSAGAATDVPPSGDLSWNAHASAVNPDGSPPTTNNLSSVFFDPVGMFSSEADKATAAGAATDANGQHRYGSHGGGGDAHFSTSGSGSGRYSQRVGGTAASFDLGFAGKMFSFFDDDGDTGPDEADPILQQVARNKSDPNAVHKQGGKVQMLLQTYNFSFDEGGGYMHVDGDGAAEGVGSPSKPKTDEENQLEGLNIGRNRVDEDVFDIAARAARQSVLVVVMFLRALLTHAKSLFECLEIASHGFRNNNSSSTAAAAAAATVWDTPRSLPRTPSLGGASTNPLRACVAHIEYLINPEVPRQQRLLQAWELISSVQGISTLTGILFFAAYCKFGRYATDSPK